MLRELNDLEMGMVSAGSIDGQDDPLSLSVNGGSSNIDNHFRDAGKGMMGAGGGMIAAGVGLAAIDGPLPFGDVIGVPLAAAGLVVGAIGAIAGVDGWIGGLFDGDGPSDGGSDD